MNQVRIHQSILAAPERQLIDAILPHLPASTTPDKLTAFGTFGAVVACLGYALTNVSVQWLWLANLGLLIHWFGDSLDGNLARYRHIERPRYGYFLDQTIDTIGNFMICFGLGLTPWVDMRVALVALAGYHMVSIYVFVRAAITHDFFVSLAKLGPTELRVLLVIMNINIMILGAPTYHLAGVPFTWADLTTLGFAFAFMVNFAYQVSHFAPILREEDDRNRAERQAATLKADDT